jgi:hypothetical protein
MARFALFLALALPLTAGAATPAFQFFQTPSHNIGCAYSGSPQNLRCDIRTGLKPPPARPKGCENDWTFGYQVAARGGARRVCAGDTVFSAGARVIGYGSTWRAGSFKCISKRTGLYCLNGSASGFFLSRGFSFRFAGSLRANRMRTPSGGIGCEFRPQPPVRLRCDVNGGVRPIPPRPETCQFEWGPGFEMGRKSRPEIVCGSDTVNLAPQTTLAYGETWRRPGFTCVSRRSGLTCRNTGRHGFFLSTQRSRRF